MEERQNRASQSEKDPVHNQDLHNDTNESAEPKTVKLISPFTIETSRLILRAARESDVDDLHECFKDAEVMRYWESLPHATPEVTRTWLAKMIAGPSNGIGDFVISLKPSSTGSPDPSNANPRPAEAKVIGKAGIWHGDEIGFLLNRAYWGRGLAREALTEVIDLAFGLGNSTGVRSRAYSVSEVCRGRKDVVADVDPRNGASLGILGKLGFEVYATKERTFQVGEEWVDSVYLSLKRESWVRRREGGG